MTCKARCLLLAFLVYGLWSIVYSPSLAGADVVIKIRAINPLETETVAPIHYPLPKEITPEDIIAKRIKFSGRLAAESGQKLEESPAGSQDIPGEEPALQESSGDPAPIPVDFAVKYDKKTKSYYVEHEVTLAPKQIVTLEIEVRDVWRIPQEQIDRVRAQVEELWGKYPDGDGTSIDLKDEILRQLDQIAASQQNSTAARAGVEKHIQAYGKNAEALRQAQMDVKMLQNLLKRAKGKKKPEGSEK